MLKRLAFYFGITLAVVLCAALFYAVVKLTPSRSDMSGTSLSQSSEIESQPGKNENTTSASGSPRLSMETRIPDSYFKLTAKSHNTIEQPKTQKVDADMEIKYSRSQTNDGVLLTFYSLGVKMSQDGVRMTDIVMTRDKIVENDGSQALVTPAGDMSAEKQEALSGAFGSVLCRLRLDENQNELDREILSESGYAMLQEGNINSAQLVHGPYFANKTHWSGIKRIPMTAGFVFDCPFEYQKAGDGSKDVKVTGKLVKDEVTSEQSDWVLRQVNCTIDATETFDEGTGDYVAGKMKLTYKFEVHQPDAVPAKMEGSMDITLEHVSSQASK
jgi:hypothetical protein